MEAHESKRRTRIETGDEDDARVSGKDGESPKAGTQQSEAWRPVMSEKRVGLSDAWPAKPD